MNIDKIQGKAIDVIDFNLNVNKTDSMIAMKFLIKDEVVRMIFHNVSSLNIKNFSMPYQIGGFEILDNNDKGWEKSHRYSVNDYEDGTIKFYCESFEII